MVPHACPFLRLGAAILAGLGLALLGAAPAQASPDTLRHALANVVGGPLDVALAPATGAMAVAKNWYDVADSSAERAIYAPVGTIGLTILQVGTGVLRTVTGALQILPGLALFPFQTDLGPGLDPFSEGPALVDLSNPLGRNPAWLKWVFPVTPFTIDLKFGIVSPAGLYGGEPGDDAD